MVLYHLLTGQYPFRAETMTDIERMHIEAPPPRPSQGAPVSPAFDAIVLRCMEKTADRRYQSVKAFIEALREAVGTKTDKPEVTAQAAAVFVEIRVAEGADAESDAVLDDTSAILDAAEQSPPGAGLGLPLQTGSAIIGARRGGREAARPTQPATRSSASPTRWPTSWPPAPPPSPRFT